jgi:hypothetical protein
LLAYIDSQLDDKERKIWQCFCVDVEYDELIEKSKWIKSKAVIDQYKADSDLDVKLYAFYMELANTGDHESATWINNINASIELWEQHTNNTFDPRLYTKYYWDKHEKFCFDLKTKPNKDILEAYYEYEQVDKDIKDFLFSKYDSQYFKDIILHKTLYTVVLFWGSVNDVSLDDPAKTIKVLQMLDEKIAGLDYKYADFNMHLLEWLWINYKWWMDLNVKDSADLVWDALIATIKQATTNKPRLIKALNHHNFSYTSRFLTFVSNLYQIEQIAAPGKQSRVLDMNWTDEEAEFIIGDVTNITKFWPERTTTTGNYQRNMILPIKNKLLG